MAQEARNTEFQESGWRSQGQLRKVPVNFVKSNRLSNVEQNQANEKHSNSSSPPKQAQIDDYADNETSKMTALNFPPLLATSSSQNRSEPTETLTKKVIYNTANDLASDDGGKPLGTAAKCSTRPAVPDESDSQTSDSDEVVLFNGRGRKPRPVPQKSQKSSRIELVIRDSPVATAQDSGESSSAGVSQNITPKYTDQIAIRPARSITRKESANPNSIAEPDVVRYTPRHQERKARRERERRAEEEAIFQDYRDNMDKTTSDDEGEEKPHETFDEALEATGDSELSWNSNDLRDFDDLSTSDDEVPQEIKRILSTRTRGSGLQYLVHASGRSIDYAKWIPRSRLAHADDLIRSFDAKVAERAAEAAALESSEDGTSEGDEDIEDLLNEMASEDDEREATSRKVARMTDYQIARALERQEMFGLPADEVLLFDDVASETGQSDDDVSLEDEDDEMFRRHRNYDRRSNTKSTRNDRRSDGFPSASAFADALDQDPYGAFDVMDFERPSLKPRSKGRRGKLDLGDIEDEELEAQLQQSWENDRQKKKVKKQERQELREQGRLGQKQGRTDMKAKYPHGMRNHQVKAELKVFLLTSKERLVNQENRGLS